MESRFPFTERFLVARAHALKKLNTNWLFTLPLFSLARKSNNL